MTASRECRRISSGDTLVVARFAYVGNASADIAATLRACPARGARVICLETGSIDLAARGEGSVPRVLELVGEVERSARCSMTTATATAPLVQG